MNYFLLFTLFLSPFVRAEKVNNERNHENGDTLLIEETEVISNSFYDTSSIFMTDWNNNVTFWYPEVNYSDSTILKLTNNKSGFIFPAMGKTTSGFGRRHSSQHKGIDIPLQIGDSIVSAFDGKVRYAKFNTGGFGNLVIVRHTNGLETYYAHLSKFKVKPNQIVKAGELIGLCGSTGRSYSPHLHFEVRYNHQAFDPEKLFDLEDLCLITEEAMVCELISKTTTSHSSHNNTNASKQASSTDLSSGTVYAIKSGDTLSKIAVKHGTSVGQLCKLNGMSESTVLQIGQKIRVK